MFHSKKVWNVSWTVLSWLQRCSKKNFNALSTTSRVLVKEKTGISTSRVRSIYIEEAEMYIIGILSSFGSQTCPVSLKAV